MIGGLLIIMVNGDYVEKVQCSMCVRYIRPISYNENKGVCGMCMYDMKTDAAFLSRWRDMNKASDWMRFCPEGLFTTRDYAENAGVHIRQAMRRLLFLCEQKRVIKKGFSSKGCHGRFRVWEVYVL